MEKGRQRGPFPWLVRRPCSLLPGGAPSPQAPPVPPSPTHGRRKAPYRARPLIPGTWAGDTQVSLRDSRKETEGQQPERGEGKEEKNPTAERGTGTTEVACQGGRPRKERLPVEWNWPCGGRGGEGLQSPASGPTSPGQPVRGQCDPSSSACGGPTLGSLGCRKR